MSAAPAGGAAIDRVTQRWVITTGRQIDLRDQPWLDGPVGSPDGIGGRWIDDHAQRVGATLHEDPGGGLLPDLSRCDGPGFDAAALHPEVRAFYETTAAFELDVWGRWSRWAEPGGRLLNAIFARRLRQLALPLDPLDTAYGMTSRVATFTADDGRHLGTAWQRALRATGATVFGGFYGLAHLPGARRASIRVVFPLPNGSVTVLLRPDHGADGSLRLLSPPGPFGAEGAYLIVRAPDRTHGWVRRVPLPERFDVAVDATGTLRCHHRLWLASLPVLQLHYRLQRSRR